METPDRMQDKLDQLRQDIQDGITIAELTPWSAEEIKQEGRRRQVKASLNR
jgi:hypothetical protein